LARRLLHDGLLNFWITNRIPRRRLTRFVGWLSRLEQPPVARLSIAVWRRFADDLRLDEAKHTSFPSLHACFVRELKDGARPVDADARTLTSPCDGVVVAGGRIEDGMLVQVKGRRYPLAELLRDAPLAARYRDGCFVTLRLKSSMYHRFHAPYDCHVQDVEHIPGDVWNVNPPALARVERLYCRNERAVLPLRLAGLDDETVTLVPVGAILVGSIRLNFVDVLFNGHYSGPHRVPCHVFLKKGEEMGYFEHGSTIIVLASGRFALQPRIRPGHVVRMGQPLLAWNG